MKLLFKPFILFLILLTHLTLTGKVVGVSDGDTIKILVGTEQVKVRLNGIDCPESSQDFGQRAKQFTSDFCFGKDVKVNSFGEDRYGRTLGDVFVDGKCLNKELVRAGYAWHFKKYSSDTTLARLEMEARVSKRGLWSQKNAMPPWEYRKTLKN